MGRMPKPNEAMKDFFKDNEVYADAFNAVYFEGEEFFKAGDLSEGDTAYENSIDVGGRIRPIMNLVIYTGERAWDGPTCLHDMLELDEDLKQFVPDYPLYLIDLGHDKEYNFRNGKLRELSELLNIIYSGEAVDREVSRSTLAIAGILANDKKLYEAANNEAEEGGTVNMCTILAERDRKSEMRGERRGIRIGEKRGEKRGEVNGQNKLVDAIQKLRNGVSRDMIIASGIDAHTVDLAMTVV